MWVVNLQPIKNPRGGKKTTSSLKPHKSKKSGHCPLDTGPVYKVKLNDDSTRAEAMCTDLLWTN